MVRILVGARLRDSHRKYFHILNILPVVSQYIINNKSLFRLNSDIRNFNTSNNSNFRHVMTHLTIYAGIKIFGHLPADIQDLSNNVEQFQGSFERIFT
jgi:hypothetical protein